MSKSIILLVLTLTPFNGAKQRRLLMFRSVYDAVFGSSGLVHLPDQHEPMQIQVKVSLPGQEYVTFPPDCGDTNLRRDKFVFTDYTQSRKIICVKDGMYQTRLVTACAGDQQDPETFKDSKCVQMIQDDQVWMRKAIKVAQTGECPKDEKDSFLQEMAEDFKAEPMNPDDPALFKLNRQANTIVTAYQERKKQIRSVAAICC